MFSPRFASPVPGLCQSIANYSWSLGEVYRLCRLVERPCSYPLRRLWPFVLQTIFLQGFPPLSILWSKKGLCCMPNIWLRICF